MTRSHHDRRRQRRHWGRKTRRDTRQQQTDQLQATVFTPEALHDRHHNPERAETANLSVLAATLGIVILGEPLIDAELDIEEALAEVVSPGEELDPSTLLSDALVSDR